MDFLLTLFKSIFTTSDIIILFFAIATGGVFYLTFRVQKALFDNLRINERLANPKEKKPLTTKEIQEHEDLVLKQRDKMNVRYAFFSNMTAIFPLLGMLGTVKSLIGVASNIAGTEIDQFFGALTSTAWGIIFAVIFKLLDSFISVKVTTNNKEVDTLLERNSGKQHTGKGVAV